MYNGGYSAAGRAADRFGHWGSGVLIASITVAIVLGVRPLPTSTPLALWLPVLLFVIVIVSWLRMRAHDRRLCELCVRAMPLDAANVAAHMRGRFIVAHLGERRALVVGYVVVLIGSNGLLVLGTSGRLGWALVQASMIYLVLAYSAHRRFQPWCPQCSGGGDGRHETITAPEPMPQGGRP